jgi:hypothetical protein
MLLVGLFSGSILVSPVVSQSTAPAQSAPAAKTAPTGKPAVVAKPATTSTPFVNRPPRISNREAALLEAVWGIADPAAKAVESGVIIRFNFRVLDPARAKALTDKNFNPVMQCPEKGVSLVIPSLEKVGQLRQAPKTIVAGQSYWMAFSNSGRPVKPGDRVDVVIGNFQARGLIVE